MARFRREILASVAKLHAAFARRSESGFRALGDELPLMLGHSCKDVDGQAIRVRIVASDEFYAAREELGSNKHASREPINASNNEQRSRALCVSDRFDKLRSIVETVFTPGLDFFVRGNDDATKCGCKTRHSLPLSRHAEPVHTLFLSRNAAVSDDLAIIHGSPPRL